MRHALGGKSEQSELLRVSASPETLSLIILVSQKRTQSRLREPSGSPLPRPMQVNLPITALGSSAGLESEGPKLAHRLVDFVSVYGMQSSDKAGTERGVLPRLQHRSQDTGRPGARWPASAGSSLVASGVFLPLFFSVRAGMSYGPMPCISVYASPASG